MQLFRLCIVFIAVCFLSPTVFAQPQEGKLTGQLTDGKKPLSYATVTLLRADSSVVNGALSEEDGSFTIQPTGYGNFILRINGIGFTQKVIDKIIISSETPEKKLGTIAITTTTKQLEEVSVTAERAVMEMSVDKKTFNVEKNITTAGGSASDVLQNVPSVSVDIDGNLSLRGKANVTVLIDGKPATLLGGDAASALQSLPASSIQSVEVITNPSAKYDAQGMTGIVNIVTKKDKKVGLNGVVTAGVGTRDKYNGSLNLNLKNDKVNVFLNSNFRLNKNYQRSTITRRDALNSYKSYEDNTRQFNGWFNTIGVEYAFNEKNSVTLTQNLNKMQWGNEGYSTYETFGVSETPVAYQRRSSDNLGGPFSSSTSLDYKHKFSKPKEELTANATFAKTWVQRDQEYITYGDDYSAGTSYGPIVQNAPGGGSNASQNTQIDYTTPFLSAKGKLDAGLKSQLYWFESSNDPYIDSPGVDRQVDYILLNSYRYSQHVHAAYTSFSDEKGKFSYQGGLRLEYATYEGTTNLAGGRNFTNDFLNLFPSAYFSYKLPKDQSIFLNYSRRTDRPSFWRMMPYRDLSNPQDTTMGNPELIPEFIHNVELSYSRQHGGHNLIAGLYYQYTQNLIDRITIQYADGTSFSQHQNLINGTTYGVDLTGRFQILPIWDATLNLNFFRNEITGSSRTAGLNVDNSGSSWFGKVNTNVKLPKEFSLQVNGNYEAPKAEAQGNRQEVYWIDVALRKNLLKGKATIVLNVSDILDTRKTTTIYNFPNSYQERYRDRETRIGNLTFTYRFGKSDVKIMGGGRRRGQQQNADQKPEVKQREGNLKGEDGGGGEGGGGGS